MWRTFSLVGNSAGQKRDRAEPRCTICRSIMKLKCTIPAAHIFPELKRFQCVECGALRSVEDETDLLTEQDA